jgi:hypothetical protein
LDETKINEDSIRGEKFKVGRDDKSSRGRGGEVILISLQTRGK